MSLGLFKNIEKCSHKPCVAMFDIVAERTSYFCLARKLI